MLGPEDAGKLARTLDMTSDEELGCDECFERLDHFVQTELAGLDAAAAMPLVKGHLDKCGDCREEYRALLRALRASEGSLSASLIWGRLRHLFGAD